MSSKRIIALTAILVVGIATFCAGRMLGSPQPN
jgi:hypothetical protein